jgi:hypothetical protein
MTKLPKKNDHPVDPIPTRKLTASPNKELQGQRKKIDPKKLYKPKIPK